MNTQNRAISSTTERQYNNERNAAIKEIIEIGTQHHYGVPRHIALEIFHTLEFHPAPEPDDVLYEIERRFNDKRGTFQCQQCRENDKGQQSDIANPIFTDKFTPESIAEKARLYEKYRNDGSDLYELKLWAEVCLQVPSMAYDTFETRIYTFTFTTFTACSDFAENLRVVPPTVLRMCLPTIDGYETEASCQSMQILQIHPTEQGEELLLGIYGLQTSKTLVWTNHEDPTELGGQAA